MKTFRALNRMKKLLGIALCMFIAPSALAQVGFPDSQIEGLDIVLLNDEGQMLGKIEGEDGTTSSDGSVEVENAKVWLYSSASDQTTPQESLYAEARKLKWISDEKRIECSEKLTLTFGKGEDSKLPISEFSATSATISYLHEGTRLEHIHVDDATDVQLEGAGMLLIAPHMTIEADFTPAEDATPNAISKLGVRRILARASQGVDIALPNQLSLGSQETTDLHAVCKSSAELRAADQRGTTNFSIKLSHAARIAEPTATFPLLAGDTLEFRGSFDKDLFALSSVEAQGEAFASVEQPQGLVQGTARILRLELEATGTPNASQAFHFQHHPILWIVQSDAPDQRAVELRADFRASFWIKKKVWSLEAQTRVRGLINTGGTGQARIHGDELSIVLENDSKTEDDQEAPVISIHNLVYLRCRGEGVVPRIALSQGENSRVALFAKTIEGRRLEDNTFGLDLIGDKLQANLTIPSAIFSTTFLARNTGQTPRAESGSYVINTRDSARIVLSSLSPLAINDTREFRIELSTDSATSLEELPEETRIRSRIECGAFDFMLSLQADPARNGKPGLREATILARAPGGGIVRTAAGFDVVDSSFLAVALSPQHVESTFGAPTIATLRSPGVLGFVNHMLEDQQAFFSTEGAPNIDAATLVTDGNVVQRMHSRETEIPEFELIVDRPFTFSGFHYGFAPRATGADALAEWDQLKVEPHSTELVMTGGFLRWKSSDDESDTNASHAILAHQLSVLEGVRFELPKLESVMRCSHFSSTSHNSEHRFELRGPVTLEAKGAGQELLASLIFVGSSQLQHDKQSRGRYTGGISLTTEGSLLASLIHDVERPLVELRLPSPFHVLGQHKDGRDSVKANAMHVRSYLANQNDNDQAFQLFELNGNVSITTSGNTVIGERLRYRPESKDFSLDGDPLAIRFKKVAAVEGIEALEFGDDEGRATLRAKGKRITLRVRLDEKKKKKTSKAGTP